MIMFITKIIFHISRCEFMNYLNSIWLELKILLKIPSHERPNSWEPLRRDFFGLLPTESLTEYTLSGNLEINFLKDLVFSAFLLRLFTEGKGKL